MPTRSLPILSQSGFFIVSGLLIAATALGGDALRGAWRFDRAGIDAGEWWRLLTGHFVHLGWAHSALNLAGVVLAGALFASTRRTAEWAAVAVGSLAAISTWLYLARPDLDWYVGYSGVLHGVFVAGALAWLVAGELEGWLLAAFLVAKLYWEQRYGALPLSVTAAGGPVVIDAHLAGALGGLFVAAPLAVRDWTVARR